MPDDIKKHARSLLKQYGASSESKAIIVSATKLARLALENEDLRPSHRRKMLSDSIWYITEADGKWKTRFKSQEVLRLAKDDPESLVKINHEHVFTRKTLIAQMIARREELLRDPGKLSDLLESAVGCVVTRDEHVRLGTGSGWERYKGMVAVCDTEKVPPVLYEPPVATAVRV